MADIAYIWISKGYVFVAAISIRHTRKVIGRTISGRIDAEMCLAELKAALDKGQRRSTRK